MTEKKYRIEVWCNSEVAVLEIPPELMSTTAATDQDIAEGLAEQIHAAVCHVATHGGDFDHLLNDKTTG